MSAHPAPGSTAPAVAIERLSRRFGNFTAVDDVSIEVGRGEVFGFLGPNGAGKTTTIKILCGLLPPSSGRALVDGFDVVTAAAEVRRRIGYMSQIFSLYADLTVDENIRFFSGLYGVAPEKREARRDWVLEMAALREHRRRLTGELSLGWKQRLALGCAVLHEPPVLFLDEPTSGVDPLSRRAFWDLIGEFSGRGTTVFVTTHYMEEAEYCHRLALMNRGRLVALGTPASLRASHREPVLEIATNEGARAVELLRGAPGVRHAGLFGRTVHAVVEDAGGSRDSLRAWLSARGVSVGRIDPIAPSLEDVFIAIVSEAGGAPAE